MSDLDAVPENIRGAVRNAVAPPITHTTGPQEPER